VSPETSFFEPGRPNSSAAPAPIAGSSEASVAVEPIVDPYAASAVDPYAEATTADTTQRVVEVTPVTSDVSAELAASEDNATLAADSGAATTPVDAAGVESISDASDSAAELRFAEGKVPAESSDAEKTITLEVGPNGESKQHTADGSRFADASEHRALQPLVVMARRMPGEPTPAASASDSEPAVPTAPTVVSTKPPEIVAAPTLVARAPRPAPASDPAEPIATSKLVPAPVAVVPTRPSVAPASEPIQADQDQATEPPAEVETPKPAVASESTLVRPQVAEGPVMRPESAQQDVEASPEQPKLQTRVSQPQIIAAAPEKTVPVVLAPAAEMAELAAAATAAEQAPQSPNPAPLKIAEVQVAPAPALVAAAVPAQTDAKPTPAAVVPSQSKPAEPKAVAMTPTPVGPSVQATAEPRTPAMPSEPASPQKVAKNVPEAVVAAPAPVIAQTAPPISQPIAPQPTPVQPVVSQPVPSSPAPVQAPPAIAHAAPVPSPAVSPQVVAPALPAAPVRSPAMVASMAQADERVRHAIQLAEKGALYASRKEFTTALTQISQARDVEFGTRQYSQATAAGLLALKEANDFVKPNAATANLSRIVAGHKTPILKDLDVSDLPPALAAQHYYDYAKVQFATGIGRETVGSIALYGLGRIIVAGAGANAQQIEYTGPAMALYQAALICEPQNFRAAHELGVLLASSGQLELARNMLLGSATASPQPMMWKNLAVVHARLGEVQLAAEAQQKAAVLEQTSPNANTPAVRWVDPATFAQMGSATDPALPPHTAPPASAAPAEAAATKKPSSVARARSEWNPLNLRR
jgi:tetratricopeptide (TPR) repeat protein